MKLIKNNKFADIKLSLEKIDLCKAGRITIGVTALGIALLSSNIGKKEIHSITEKEYVKGTDVSYSEHELTLEGALIGECSELLSNFDSVDRAYVKDEIILEKIEKNIKGNDKNLHDKNILNEETDKELVEQIKILAEDISKNPEKYNYDNSIYTDGVTAYLGTYLVTSYCGCSSCCGSASGITASGAVATPNHTLAADSSFPFGTKLVINGETYVVEDRGGAVKGKHLDMFFSNHSTALAVGTRMMDVYLEDGSKKEAESKNIPSNVKTLALRYSK